MIEELQKIGLTAGESKVYLALLKLGPSKVGNIVKESNVSYSKVYDVLERLVSKGLASETVIQKTKHYRAVEPFQLSEYIHKKEEEVAEQKKVLDGILGDLKALNKEQERNKAELFFGLSGIKTAYSILMEEEEKVLRFFYPAHSFGENTFYRRLYPKLEEKGISVRGIGSGSKPVKLPKNVKIKTVSFPVPGTIDIIGSKTLILSWTDNPTAVLIHSAEITDHFKRYFDSVWNVAE
ncbi:hypothetical protein COV20_00220 [Candidatus Woesearchaeota archaeon CG10_big_fil_rev_8_21_14_0_10_45_16]|nr:MAG: hypothetical protein COV20_00220 [Candidatus Woesearchaeota archaeon CG10_big_fil_rev_8_21_14_0_10_45_16]